MADIGFGGRSGDIVKQIATTVGGGGALAAAHAGAAATWLAIVAAAPYVIGAGVILGAIGAVASLAEDDDKNKTTK